VILFHCKTRKTGASHLEPVPLEGESSPDHPGQVRVAIVLFGQLSDGAGTMPADCGVDIPIDEDVQWRYLTLIAAKLVEVEAHNKFLFLKVLCDEL
jgi:hypothetical protein